MSMPRKVQRSIWRQKMRCRIYSPVTTGQPLGCGWYEEDYNSIKEHWLRHCPASSQQNGLKLRKEKCKFMTSPSLFFGHVINEPDMSPMKVKMDAIHNAPQ